MLSTKKTKIVATLGPATDTREILKNMMEAGANVFRINFSHADYEDVKNRIEMIRSINKEFGYNTAILADLQGPKLRVGVMEDGVIVNPGDRITFVTGEPFVGDKERVYMNYKEFSKDVNPGERILLDDGKLIFEVVSTNRENEVEARVIQGGPLKSKKGVNLPNTNVSLPALTEKDIKDALFAISQEIDWFALSFVRHSKDILARRRERSRGSARSLRDSPVRVRPRTTSTIAMPGKRLVHQIPFDTSESDLLRS